MLPSSYIAPATLKVRLTLGMRVFQLEGPDLYHTLPIQNKCISALGMLSIVQGGNTSLLSLFQHEVLINGSTMPTPFDTMMIAGDTLCSMCCTGKH